MTFLSDSPQKRCSLLLITIGAILVVPGSVIVVDGCGRGSCLPGNTWWSMGECQRAVVVVFRWCLWVVREVRVSPKGVRGPGKVPGSPRERQVATTGPGVWWRWW